MKTKLSDKSITWASDLEEGALEQIKNIEEMPMLFQHGAYMSDCHRGFGLPIGGVVALKDCICVNFVGVDIGCFTGDTKIALLDGTQKTLKELEEKKQKFYVYSLDSNNNLVPGLADPIKTRRNAKLMEVYISGGEKITCTPDHKFMMRDGSYKEAMYLETNDSLMPLYRHYQTRDGYESVLNPGTNKYVQTHRYFYSIKNGQPKKGHHVHHRNDNKWDNDPTNFELLSKKEHAKLTGKKHIERLQSDEFKINRIKTLQKNGFYAEEFKEKKKKVAIKNITSYIKTKKFKEDVKTNGKRGKKYLVKYNKSEKGKNKSKEIANRLYECEICGEKIKSPIGLYNHKKNKHNNHKVMKTELISHTEDVYCLNVPKYHNFALAAGIFVHNCGMGAVKFGVKADVFSIKDLTEIREEIKKVVPVGFAHHQKVPEKWDQLELFMGGPSRHSLLAPILERIEGLKSTPDVEKYIMKQLGTLGGGNHFIELQVDDKGYLWAMLHSGSRNMGKLVCDYYKDLSVKEHKKWYITSDEELKKDLAWIPVDTKLGQDYLTAMNFCLDFAMESRKRMMDKVIGVVMCALEKKDNYETEVEEEINIHHNYVALENHFNHNVWVHRKGATSAKIGQKGIIPGNMSKDSASFIVEGLGNPISYMSCSHGAGRKMGRMDASRRITEEEATKAMGDVVFGGFGTIKKGKMKGKVDLGECHQAYKDIHEVIANQVDLVKPIVTLKALATLKG